MLSRFALADAIVSSIFVVAFLYLLKKYTSVDFNDMKTVLPGAFVLIFVAHIVAYQTGLVDFFAKIM